MLFIDFIRHAECLANVHHYLIGGRSDSSPITKEGYRQIGLLGDRLQRERVGYDEVYVSPAIRTRETAEGTCKRIGYPLERIVAVDELQELDQGDWEGRLRLDVYTPEIMGMMRADPWNFKAPRGESQRGLEERVHGWVRRQLVDRYDAGCMKSENPAVALFTHGFTTKCFLRGVLDSDPGLTYRINTDNTSLTQVAYDEAGWHLICINDSSHLDTRSP